MPKFANGDNKPWRNFETKLRVWLEEHEIVNIVGIGKQKLALIMAMKGCAMRACEQHGTGKPSFEAAVKDALRSPKRNRLADPRRVQIKRFNAAWMGVKRQR